MVQTGTKEKYFVVSVVGVIEMLCKKKNIRLSLCESVSSVSNYGQKTLT